MKRHKNRIDAGIILGVMILMSAAPAIAEDITLHTEYYTYQAGSIANIPWTYNGSFEPNVTVELLKDGTLIGTIASDAYIGDILWYNNDIPYGEGNRNWWNISVSIEPGMYQLKITGHNLSGLEITDTNDIEITAGTTENCRSCHGGPASESHPHPAATIHHVMVTDGRTQLGCSDCHPVFSGQSQFYVEDDCLNCHNGTAFWANPIVDPGPPHLNPIPVPPVINSVILSDNTPNTGDLILVTVNATDDVSVTSVVANGVSLNQSNDIWTGSITAIEGTHSVNVSASDGAGVVWNNSTSYTAIVPSMAEDIILLIPGTLPASSIVPIRWSYSGFFEPNVTVELFKDGILNRTIVSDTYIGDILYYDGGIPYGEGQYIYWAVPLSLNGTYVFKITGNTTSGLQVTNTSDIEITAATAEYCRACHPDGGDRMHALVNNGAINPITDTPFSCPDCHPVQNWEMLIERNCLNCHNGTAFWANPLVINPGEPHTEPIVFPPQNTPPSINSVTLSTNTPNTGDLIQVTVNATETDNDAVYSVKANDVPLTKQSDDIWSGNITAIEGTHLVNVTAADTSGHRTWDESTSYNATTPNIIVTSPRTGDNWIRGTTHTITWIYTGNLGSSATVELLEQEVDKTWTNVSQANGVGSLEWAIPSRFDVSTYHIRVSAGGYSNTTGNFNIVKR